MGPGGVSGGLRDVGGWQPVGRGEMAGAHLGDVLRHSHSSVSLMRRGLDGAACRTGTMSRCVHILTSATVTASGEGVLDVVQKQERKR